MHPMIKFPLPQPSLSIALVKLVKYCMLFIRQKSFNVKTDVLSKATRIDFFEMLTIPPFNHCLF